MIQSGIVKWRSNCISVFLLLMKMNSTFNCSFPDFSGYPKRELLSPFIQEFQPLHYDPQPLHEVIKNNDDIR